MSSKSVHFGRTANLSRRGSVWTVFWGRAESQQNSFNFSRDFKAILGLRHFFGSGLPDVIEVFSSSFSGTFFAFLLTGPSLPRDLFLLSPLVTFSAGSVEDTVELRLPADWKNRLRTACLPGAAETLPDADFVRGIPGCRRASPSGARGPTTPRLRARTPRPAGSRPGGGGA